MATEKAIQNDAGQFGCPRCSAGSVFVPLKPCRGKLEGRAWGCSRNEWDARTKSAKNPATGGPGCSFLHWTRSGFQQREVIPRPADWPKIAKRTAEQAALRSALAVKPGTPIDYAGGRVPSARCKTVNAVPGSGKSTSMADDAEAIWAREGAAVVAESWHLTAFNTNARTSLELKLPAHWPNISTINGFGGRLQGFNSRNYKPAKCTNIFRELVANIEPKKRPSAAGIKAFAERVRDMLLYRDDTDPGQWADAISLTADRFPALAKALEKNADAIREYLPQVLTRAMSDRTLIDLTEQYARPALEAIRETGWKARPECCDRSHKWTDDDCEHLARLVRAVRVRQVRGVIVDEAQDLSLSQIVLFLAATWRSGELILVGDDRDGEPGDDHYKAGQAIFGWRGAFPGSLALVSRLWETLTGEKPQPFALSVSFRCPPEVCEAVRPLNQVMRSAKPAGTGEVASVSAAQAFSRWLEIPEKNADGKPFQALWITRRNAPLAPLFMATLRERKQVALRGGKDMAGAIDAALFDAAGWRDDATEEYRVPLDKCLVRLAEIVNEQADGEAGADADSMESFLLEVGTELAADPSLLTQAELPAVATVGNLRRFILYFACKDAPRVLSTVYRSKGDEADLVIVDDCEALNTAWNGDAEEAAACRHVAATRTRQSLLIVGALAGVIVPGGPVAVVQLPDRKPQADTPEDEPAPRPATVKASKPAKGLTQDASKPDQFTDETTGEAFVETQDGLKPLPLTLTGEPTASKPKRKAAPRKAASKPAPKSKPGASLFGDD